MCSSRSDLPGSDKDNEVTQLTPGASEALGGALCGDSYQDSGATTSKKPLGLVCPRPWGKFLGKVAARGMAHCLHLTCPQDGSTWKRDPFQESGLHLSPTAAEAKEKARATRVNKRAPQMDWNRKREIFSNF